jgi:hypothetical protein
MPNQKPEGLRKGGGGLPASFGRREPADQPAEEQPNLRRKWNASRHADEDPKQQAKGRAHDDRPHPSAISGRNGTQS